MIGQHNKNAFLIFMFLALAVLSIVVVSGSVSALTFGTPTSNHPLDAITPNNNITVTLTNDDTENLNIALDFTGITNNFANRADFTVKRANGDVVFQNGQATEFALPTGITETLTVLLAKTNSLKFSTTSTVKLNANATLNNNPISAEKTLKHFESFCKKGPNSPIRNNDYILELSKVKISNDGSSDGDKDEWYPFDDISITVKVENNGDKDLSSHDLNDIVIEIGLLDSSGSNIINNYEFISGPDQEDEEIGDLDPDDTDEVVWKIRLEDSDEDFEGRFDFVVKAYEDGNEDEVCMDYSRDLDDNNEFSQSIDLERENQEEKFVRFNDIDYPSEVTCSEAVQLRTDVVNIGDDDTDNVDVRLISTELGLDITKRIVGGLDQGDQDSVVFEFVVPSDLADKAYRLILTSEYEVDDDPVSSDIEETVLLNVIGCSTPSTPTDDETVVISASLASSAEIGKPLVVVATITNLGSDTATFVINAKSFDSWAVLDSISERVLSIGPGAGKTTTLTFNIKEDKSICGSQSFLMEVTSNGQTELQEVEVNISCPAGSTGGFSLGSLEGNSLIWIIAIVNIILIVLIILVAVKLSRN